MQDTEPQENQPVSAAEKKSLFALIQKLRLPFLIVGGVLVALILILVGIWIGTAKRNADMKQYEERLAAARKQVEASENEQKLLTAKLEGFSGSLKNAKENEETRNLLIGKLQEKLDCFEQAAAQAIAAEQSAAHAASAKKSPAKTKADSSAREYVRFGNSSCTLVAGGSSNNWKDCLKKGRRVAGAEESKEKSH